MKLNLDLSSMNFGIKGLLNSLLSKEDSNANLVNLDFGKGFLELSPMQEELKLLKNKLLLMLFLAKTTNLSLKNIP